MSERREIGFRAWDTRELEMIPNVFDNFHGSGDLLQESRFIPMQYTGLKDKNGKEIYEGDILSNDKSGEWESGDGERGVVEWETDRSRWDLIFYSIYGGEGHLGAEEDLAHRVFLLRYEVIGNIYESPGLLGGTSENPELLK